MFEDYALASFNDYTLFMAVVDSDIVIFGLMQLQDEVILSDAERLRITQSNVKMVFYSSVCLSSWLISLKYASYLITFCSFKGIFKLKLCLGLKE